MSSASFQSGMSYSTWGERFEKNICDRLNLNRQVFDKMAHTQMHQIPPRNEVPTNSPYPYIPSFGLSQPPRPPDEPPPPPVPPCTYQPSYSEYNFYFSSQPAQPSFGLPAYTPPDTQPQLKQPTHHPYSQHFYQPHVPYPHTSSIHYEPPQFSTSMQQHSHSYSFTPFHAHCPSQTSNLLMTNIPVHVSPPNYPHHHTTFPSFSQPTPHFFNDTQTIITHEPLHDQYFSPLTPTFTLPLSNTYTSPPYTVSTEQQPPYPEQQHSTLPSYSPLRTHDASLNPFLNQIQPPHAHTNNPPYSNLHHEPHLHSYPHPPSQTHQRDPPQAPLETHMATFTYNLQPTPTRPNPPTFDLSSPVIPNNPPLSPLTEMLDTSITFNESFTCTTFAFGTSIDSQTSISLSTKLEGGKNGGDVEVKIAKIPNSYANGTNEEEEYLLKYKELQHNESRREFKTDVFLFQHRIPLKMSNFFETKFGAKLKIVQGKPKTPHNVSDFPKEKKLGKNELEKSMEENRQPVSTYVAYRDGHFKTKRVVDGHKKTEWVSYSSGLPADVCDYRISCGGYDMLNVDNNPLVVCLDTIDVKYMKDNYTRTWSTDCLDIIKIPSGWGNCYLLSMYSGLQLPNMNSFYEMTMSIERYRIMCIENCSCTTYCFLWFKKLFVLSLLVDVDEGYASRSSTLNWPKYFRIIDENTQFLTSLHALDVRHQCPFSVMEIDRAEQIISKKIVLTLKLIEEILEPIFPRYVEWEESHTYNVWDSNMIKYTLVFFTFENMRSDVVSKGIQAPGEVLIDLYFCTVIAKVDRGDEDKGLSYAYWNMGDSLLELLCHHAKGNAQDRYEYSNERIEEQTRLVLEKLLSDLRATVKRNKGYQVMWSLCYDVYDSGLLRTLVYKSIEPTGEINDFVFQLLYISKNFFGLMRLWKEFQDHLVINLSIHTLRTRCILSGWDCNEPMSGSNERKGEG